MPCGLAEEVGAHRAAERAGVGGAHRHVQAVPVAPALPHLLGVVEAVDVRRAAGEAVRDAVAVLAHDDGVVEVAVHVGRGVRPDVHLHAGVAAEGAAAAVGGGVEVGVVRAGAVLRLRHHAVLVAEGAAGAGAAAVVVLLEVPRRLVEAVLVHQVVDEVVPVEEVRDGGRPVGRGRLREVQREVERQRGPAVRDARRVRGVVVVGVGVGVDVVAAADGELGPGRAVRVVPAVRRGDGVLAARDHDAGVGGRERGGVVRALDGAVVDAVRGAAAGRRREGGERRGGLEEPRPDRLLGLLELLGHRRAPRVVDHLVLAVVHGAAHGVHEGPPHVRGRPLGDEHDPREAGRPGLVEHVDELHGRHVARHAAIREDEVVVAAVLLQEHGEGLRRAEPGRLGGGLGGGGGGEGGGRGGGLRRQAGDELPGHVEHPAVAVEVHAHLRAHHLDPVEALAEVDVGDPAAGVRVGDGEVGEVGRGDAVAGLVAIEVRPRLQLRRLRGEALRDGEGGSERDRDDRQVAVDHRVEGRGRRVPRGHDTPNLLGAQRERGCHRPPVGVGRATPRVRGSPPPLLRGFIGWERRSGRV
jgi:hypothetical protein